MAKVGWAQVFSQTEYNEPELADFCPTCGNLLHFKIANKQIECTLCNNKFHTSKIKSKRSKELPFFEERPHEEEAKKSEKFRATIKETCPNCSHDVAYFDTAQTRSADEGQTVFYECMKCSNKWTLNS